MKELGGFTLERPLGRGATAQVYLAVRKGTSGDRVALKVFHPGFWDQEHLRKRAMGEFRAISTLKHPNIVQVIEAAWDQDPPAVAFEFIDGHSLEDFQNRLPYILPEVAVLVVIEVLKALEHAHAQGVIHRDLKPANIMVGFDGRVLVTDFGLAKMTDVSRLTLSGTILGSPDYMSPEQARGDVTTPRSDVFAAAAVLYFLITGTRPFTRHSPLATLAAVSEAAIEPAQRRNPKLSAELAALIHRGLAKDPRDRFTSATEFRAALSSYLLGLGLNDESFSFPRWVQAPTDVSLSTLKSVSDHLVFRAEALMRDGEWDASLQALSHLSLVAPESGAIPRLMEEFENNRTRERRKRVLWPLLAASIAAIALGGWFALRTVNPEPDRIASSQAASLPPASPVEAAAPATAAVSVPVSAPISVSAPNSNRTETESQTETPTEIHPPSRPARSNAKKSPPASDPSVSRESAAPTARPTGVVRFDIPRDVRVFWDGKPIDPSEPLRGVTTGAHRIHLERPGTDPIAQTIRVKAGEPTVIRVR